jgi:hypothetical protein
MGGIERWTGFGESVVSTKGRIRELIGGMSRTPTDTPKGGVTAERMVVVFIGGVRSGIA